MALNCIIDEGYPLGCVQTGGVDKVYIGTYSSDVVLALDADNVITGVTSSISGTPVVYLFEQEIESASLTQTGSFSRENLSTSEEIVLTIKLFGWTSDLRNTYNALKRAPLFAVVKLNTGEDLVYLGAESAGRASEGVVQSGLSLNDMNGANISITWKTVNGAYLLDSSVLGNGITIG